MIAPWRAAVTVTAALALTACVTDLGDPASDVDGGADAAPPRPDAGPFRSVADVAAEDCATVGVRGLALQISETIRCDEPDLLATFDESAEIVFRGSNVVPYLAPQAVTALEAAAAASPAALQVNSAFRTVAEQQLLYTWADEGRCNIAIAAEPGSSNHESGRALDLQNYAAAEAAMNARGWTRNVPNDPVHFEYLSAPDIRGRDVLAFQELWNLNHPEDPIDTDGDYGPATAARLLAAPADGFDEDACPAARRGRLRILANDAARARRLAAAGVTDGFDGAASCP